MAIRVPVLSVDDQEYYPLHEEDDVPETPPHRQEVTYAYMALRARFREWFTTANVCVYWERGNTKDYRAPDLFVVKEPLSEPVTRVYQLWKQPPIAFALEVGSRSTFWQEVGPKVKLYQEQVKAAEYAHVDLDRRKLRLWRLGPNGYEPVAPEANRRLRSAELELEFDLDEAGNLRLYTLDGEPLRSREESEEQLEVTEQRLEVATQRLEEEARRRREAEERAADLERQLAELRAGRVDRDNRSA